MNEQDRLRELTRLREALKKNAELMRKSETIFPKSARNL